MKYDPINPKLFINNRKNFMAQMQPSSLAVFNSNDVFTTGADSTLPFKQHRDIFYLSGADQEETVLVLFPDCPDPDHREVLFVTETNDHIAVWEGEKLTKEKATEITGIKTIYWLKDLDKKLFEMITQCDTVYLNTNEHYRQSIQMQSREARFIEQIKDRYPAHRVARSAPILQRLRAVKDPMEIELLQQACDITQAGFDRVLKFLKPGVKEYEIEAEFLHEFIRRRSDGFAYTPIIASGNNANVLHYIQNNGTCNEGELLLIDAGASYANYASDMSRTIPVSGRYTQRQKDVYNAVLRVKDEATKMLVPGTMWKAYHIEVGKLMTSELLGLGLLDKADVQNENPDWPAYKKYFMHGTSHHIGLDTHDYGILWEPMQAGNVFTVEPGIYLPDEGFGIRLEDDVVINETGAPFNLMRNIPIEVEAIEEAMNS